MNYVKEQLESAEKDLDEAQRELYDWLATLAGALHHFWSHGDSYEDNRDEATAHSFASERYGLMSTCLAAGNTVEKLNEKVELLRVKAGDGKPHKYRLEGEVPMNACPSAATEPVIAENPFEALEKFAEQAIAYVESEEGGWMMTGTVEVQDSWERGVEVFEVLDDGTERKAFAHGRPWPY